MPVDDSKHVPEKLQEERPEYLQTQSLLEQNSQKRQHQTHQNEKNFDQNLSPHRPITDGARTDVLLHSSPAGHLPTGPVLAYPGLRRPPSGRNRRHRPRPPPSGEAQDWGHPEASSELHVRGRAHHPWPGSMVGGGPTRPVRQPSEATAGGDWSHAGRTTRAPFEKTCNFPCMFHLVRFMLPCVSGGN